MFNPKTDRIKQLADKYPSRIKEMEGIFNRRTNIYIDYANVRPWADKLGWHVDLKRLKQFLDSFDTIGRIKIYNGTLVGDIDSEQSISDINGMGYEVITKPVKIMRKSIDVSSISAASPDILKNFIRKPLLRLFKLETVEYLNKQLKDLNSSGVLYVEDPKCNFDVEIASDMIVDHRINGVDTFVLWSGDSDFVSPIEQLLRDGKKVFLFATARRVASEFNDLEQRGLVIFDIQKIRNFICWKKEIIF